jgi:carboxypeptidase T
MMTWRSTLASLTFLAGSALAAEGQLVRFALTDDVKSYLKQRELDVTGVNYKTMEIEALLTPAELAELGTRKTTIRYSFPQSLVAGPDARYQNPDEIEDFVRSTHARYPDITEVRVIGKTLEGREILALKISDNAAVDETEPVVLVNAMHHAREVMTPEITTDMIDYLTSRYGQDADVTRWVDRTEIWVIPMFNLDGNQKMWLENPMWRKNTRGGFGVDLNRNYPTGWNSCNGSSGRETAQDYRGTAPASEPETAAMMNFVTAIKPVFNISYHSYSEIVIYPFGCRPRRTPAEEAVEAIGAEIGKKLDYKPGTAWELLYNADGGDIDWMYTEHQVIPFVIEINSTQDGFHPDYSKTRDKTVLRNRAGWMHLFARLEGPSLQGVAADKGFKTIEVSKAGAAAVAQTYRINPDGSFYVILNKGVYDVTFEGARTQRFEGVSVDGVMTFDL